MSKLTLRTEKSEIIPLKNAVHAMIQPGDGTHYEFIIAPTECDEIVVCGYPGNGAGCPPLVLPMDQLRSFCAEYFDTLNVPYEEYRDVSARVINDHYWPKYLSGEFKVSEWTALAAIICAWSVVGDQQ